MVVGKKPTLSKIVQYYLKKNGIFDDGMVWGWTSLLGCAINRCDNLQTNPRKCVYFPDGNYRTAKPYTEGPSCSRCSSEHRCNRNQCSRY
ncbi:unnamed protein product [Mesocestoides corti]|uniref:SCP domain-containing protein n=1 Tax=Mesocestoides corti TaxID=53468 RepID=A0A158QVH8_MESCO|nr:unnamed protein product [Mesocestoides corti]